jgi:cytidylate kinase
MKYSKITISGKICTGKSSLFNALQNKLLWKTFSTGQYFREYAQKHKLDLTSAEEQNEKLTKKIDYKVRDMLKKKGNLIIDSWMAGIMADDLPYVLKILLISNDSIRFKRFAKKENINYKEAKNLVLTRDNNWFKKVSKIHHRKDFFDPDNYDLVINTSHISKLKVLSLALKALNKE